jgi:hypothetical protein
MATKIIISFAGPLTSTAIEGWLGQCEDGFSIYTSTKTDKAPDLTVETKIRLTRINMQEPTMAAWWNAGRTEFLKLDSWETFEKQIRSHFMPKGYKMVALRTFFLHLQNHLPFWNMPPPLQILAMCWDPMLSQLSSTSTNSFSMPTPCLSFESWPSRI